MRLLTISNLYPRPDKPARGMFNTRLFGAMAASASVRNLCLVPEWRLWRWPVIRRWSAPASSRVETRYVPVFHIPVFGRSAAASFCEAALRREMSGLERPDAILAAWLYPDGVAAVAAGREAGVPVWILVQGSDTFHLESTARRRAILSAARQVEGFFCVCRLLADRLVAAGVPSAKVQVAANGVDASEFRPLPRRKSELYVAESCPQAFSGVARRRLLFVGNMDRVKGPDIALDVLACLLEKTGRASAELVFVGEGPMRGVLQRRALDRRLDDCVFFAGSRPCEEIVHWMNAADVLLLPSRSEGMPNVVLESMACGLPVVATDVGACREMLSAEPLARVVPCGDAGALASAVAELLNTACDRGEWVARRGQRTWTDMARQITGVMGEHRPRE